MEYPEHIQTCLAEVRSTARFLRWESERFYGYAGEQSPYDEAHFAAGQAYERSAALIESCLKQAGIQPLPIEES